MGFLYLFCPIIFFVGLYLLLSYRIENKTLGKVTFLLFLANVLILIYILYDSYDDPYITMYYGILGVIGFVFSFVGLAKYFSKKEIEKEQKIKIVIFIAICLIIGFGMCSTTGIFGF